MKYSLTVAAILAATVVSAAPSQVLSRRQFTNGTIVNNNNELINNNSNQLINNNNNQLINNNNNQIINENNNENNNQQNAGDGQQNAGQGEQQNQDQQQQPQQGQQNAGQQQNQGQQNNNQQNGGQGQQVVTATAVTDTDIFNFALKLEQLELAFYTEGLSNYTANDFTNAGLPAAFYNNLQTVAAHEQTRVSFLEGVLGGQAVQPCTYDFPSTSPASFLQFSAAIEAVGVGAYLGALPLIQDSAYVTQAGSITTVEARHTAYLRYARSLLNNASEIPATERSPFPSPFDVPLTPSEANTVISRYIVECPQELSFVNTFPLLNLVGGVLGSRNDDPLIAGSQIELTPGNDFAAQGQSLYAAFPTQSGPIFAPVSESENGYTTTVPAGINGQAYVVLTNSANSVADENIVAGPAVLQINNPTV